MTGLTGLVVPVGGLEAARMGTYPGTFSRAVALKADIAIGVAGLAGLEVSPRFGSMVARPHIGLTGTAPQVGFDPHIPHGKTAVARLAVFHVMAAGA